MVWVGVDCVIGPVAFDRDFLWVSIISLGSTGWVVVLTRRRYDGLPSEVRHLEILMRQKNHRLVRATLDYTSTASSDDDDVIYSDLRVVWEHCRAIARTTYTMMMAWSAEY